MKKALNILTIGYGVLLFISGILKLMGLLQTIELHLGGKVLTISNSTSMFYIVAVNFLGGISFVYHALKTLHFQNIRLNFVDNPDKSILASEIEYAKPLSTFVFITGLYTFFVSFWLFIKLFMLLGSFENNILAFWDLLLLTIIIYVPFAILPAILVFRNIDLSREVEAKRKSTQRKK